MNHEDVIQSVKLSYGIVLAFCISIAVLIVFGVASKVLNDWTWFARSGSILVCIGVFTASYDIKGKMERNNAPDSYMSQTIVMEATIVVVGTLVWGFGDLLGLLID